MQISQILAAARNSLNGLTDGLWSDAELYISLYMVELRVSREARPIENTYDAQTVAGTAQYIKPTRAIEIVGVTYNGTPLNYMDYRQYYAMNVNASTSSGTPANYAFRDDAFFLYPTPDTAGDLQVFTYDEPDIPTANSVLETPSAYHDVLVDGLTARMCPKDLGHPLTVYWKAEFENGLERVVQFSKRRKRGNKYNVVKSEETLNTNQFGIT